MKGDILEASTTSLVQVVPTFFPEADEGPFWIFTVEREERRHEKVLEGQFLKWKLSKEELT